MFYTDLSFLLLFFTLVVLIRLLPIASRKYFLIALSLCVIATWGWLSLIVFMAFVIFGFLLAGILSNTEKNKLVFRRNILLIGILFNLLLLIFFKYREFLFGHNFLNSLGNSFVEIGIPLGISFYSFHIISYLVDLYRGNYRRASFFDFLFYLSFFPHVIAGPIVRGWQLLPQVNLRRDLKKDFIFGTHLFVTGLFLKTVCADTIGAAIDPYWVADGPKLNATGYWSVAILYYFQLYGDFAGYSLMACGMARLLGYRLPANFRGPLRAVGFQDFWRRWHITLSRWLRDYLYIPLGGNRYGMTRTCMNLLIVMALGGLWHGAAWTFVIWGLFHGGGLLIERLLGVHNLKGWRVPVWWLISQMIILLAWVFFRSPSIATACDFLSHMFTFAAGSDEDKKFLRLSVLTLPLLLHNFAPMLLRSIGHSRLLPVLGGLTGLMLISTLLIKSPPKVFIYFAF